MSETKEKVRAPKVEILDEQPEAQLSVPSMNVNVSAPPRKEDENPVVNNEAIVGLYKEILDYCREDRKDAQEAFKTFMDMVINDGDATSSSKEAMVNLLKIKSDVSDKMTKVMDLLMRVILKDRDTFPRYMAAQQENKFIFKGGDAKRNFLEKLGKREDK